MKRRGLNFITDSIQDSLDVDQMETLEGEVDNVAPKIVAILSLHSSCDVRSMRQNLVEHCKDYTLNVLKKKDEESKDGDIEDQFRAYICPNPGSSSNMGSKK